MRTQASGQGLLQDPCSSLPHTGALAPNPSHTAGFISHRVTATSRRPGGRPKTGPPSTHFPQESDPPQGAHSPVQVVEEGEEVESQLAPGLLLTVAQGVCVHDHRRVIGQLGAVRRTVEVPAGETSASPALGFRRDI